jgi:hypothetical protein
MNGADSLGWCAAALTLLTFAARDMRLLRMAALAANLCFIAYATAIQLWPVLALHLVLVPVNLLRLMELGRLAATRPTTANHPQEAAPSEPSGTRS